QKWQYQLLLAKSLSYSTAQQTKLKNSTEIPADDLLSLDISFGEWLGQQARAFIDEHQLEVDYIASHGHTVFHQPERRMTYQIGHGQMLAQTADVPVVCDFRTADVLLGGQGAPLVPIGDQTLFSEYDFCLNLGGISNVSLDLHGKRIAYDIGPANMLLNYLSKKIGLAFDRGGRIAKEGTTDQNLLAQLRTLAYYQQPFPKSLGYEWFVAEIVPIFEVSALSIQDQLSTATEHIAEILAQDILHFNPKDAQLLVTGGGALNEHLMMLLQAKVHPYVKIVIPEKSIIEYKEAIIFGLMGAKRLSGEVNCLASVTGASQDVIGGRVFYP
ncbi:MAG: anhydro-N-acetylmuramic acid kinase, partial [Bacteroidota bacterium]